MPSDLEAPPSASPTPAQPDVALPAAGSAASTRAARGWTWPFWNADERRPRALLRIVAQQLLMVLLALALATTLRLLPFGRDAAVITPFVAFASWASVWLAGRFVDKRSWREFGLQLDRAWWLDLAFGLLVGALLMTAGFVCEYALGWLHVESVLIDVQPPAVLTVSLARALALFIAVGFYEELLSRGYLLRNVAEGLSSSRVSSALALVAAALLTALLFGLAHSGNQGATVTSTVNVALAGVLLALPYVLTGRLALSIGFHITWNLFQGPVFGLPVSGQPWRDSLITIRQTGPEHWTGGAFGPEAGLVGLLLMALAALLMLAWTRWREGRLGLHVALCAAPTRPMVESAKA